MSRAPRNAREWCEQNPEEVERFKRAFANLHQIPVESVTIGFFKKRRWYHRLMRR